MAERKNKRGSENSVTVDSEDLSFILEPNHVEVGSGYTVAVSYGEDERPIVDVKTYGQVDIAQLRRDIGRAFPDAHIRRLNQARSVSVTKVKQRKKKSRKR
ncbi:MAG TPA: hypothetical protein VEC97_04815 [Candidatus Acidoferrales bacterium]|nr:hypothetical protein [Candidatus Acidoferrales bacterium]